MLNPKDELSISKIERVTQIKVKEFKGEQYFQNYGKKNY